MNSCVRLGVIYDRGSVTPRRMYVAARQLGIELIFIVPDVPHNTLAAPALQRLGQVLNTPADAVSSAREIASEGLDGILTFSEFQVRATSELAEILELPNHPKETAHIAASKIRQRIELANHGIDTPKFALVNTVSEWRSVSDQISYPCVVKPVYGAGSASTCMAKSERDLVSKVEILPPTSPTRPYIVESLLRGVPQAHPWGDYVGIDTLIQSGEPRYSFVTGKFSLAPPFRERGGYAGAYSFTDETKNAAVALAERAIKALGFQNGFVGVEIKFTPEGPRIIELNGRLGAWVEHLSANTGFADVVADAFRVALGDFECPSRPRPIDTIAYHYSIVPPMNARTVTSANLQLLRDLADVRAVYRHVVPGATVDWREGAGSTVASISGGVGTLDELATLVSEVERTPWIEYGGLG